MNDTSNNAFLRACAGAHLTPPPIWLMRQAGRYMAAYRQMRAQHDFWEVCRTPELACAVTMQPIDAFGFDAAILFSDILTVLPPMGLEVAFTPGPELAAPVRTDTQVRALRRFDPREELPFVYDALRLIKGELGGRAALIGFGGAPLTLAAYMVEGGKSKHFAHLKALLRERPQTAHALLDFLVDVQIDYLRAQVEAGADAIQIFDTWGGVLDKDLFATYVVPAVARLVGAVQETGVPVIYFLKEGAHVLDLLHRVGADVYSVDEKLPLDTCAQAIGAGKAVQGNLDPTALLGDQRAIAAQVRKVLSHAPRDKGYIFNLGHGILPGTPEENVAYLIACVRAGGAEP